MAQTIFNNVRLAHLTKTTEEWASYSKIPLKGELLVEMNTDEEGNVSTKIKIGDGEHAFSALAYVGGEEKNTTPAYYLAEEVAKDEEVDDTWITTKVLEQGGIPKAGDIFVVGRNVEVYTGTQEYQPYIAQGKFSPSDNQLVWKPLYSKYSAENIYFSKDFTYTSPIGVKTVPSSGSGTISAIGKNLEQVLSDVFAKEENPKTTAPTATLNSTNIGSYEVGTTVAVAYSFSTSAGSYTYGPATGVSFSGHKATFNGETKEGASGTFASYQITDDTSLSITGEVSYSDGAVPLTNIGNTYEEGKIKAGKLTPSKGTLSGFRKTFYGTLTDKTQESTSAVIRGLAGKSTAALKNGSTFSISLPIGATSVVFAYPATLRDVSKVEDVNGMNADVTSAFAQSSIEVLGANEYKGIAYKVYRTDFAEPVAKANTYKVQI